MNNKELLEKIERLEKALNKACYKLSWLYDDLEDEKFTWDIDDWKRWAMENDE